MGKLAKLSKKRARQLDECLKSKPKKKKNTRKLILKRKKINKYNYFSVYCKSTHWKTTRIRQLKENPYCFCCGKPAIQVHHNTYKKLYAETSAHLVSVCVECHEGIHTLHLNEPINFSKAHIIYKSLVENRTE